MSKKPAFTVEGKQAKHDVFVFDKPLTRDDFYKLGGATVLDRWSPENGARFLELSKAQGWLKRLLKKHGWPTSSAWAIYRSINRDSWHCYIILKPEIFWKSVNP